MKRSRFALLHPVVIFAYFAGTLVTCMSTLNPLYVVMTLAGALLLALASVSLQKTLTTVLFFVPMFLVIVGANLFFNQLGETPLFTLFNHRLSAEALIFSAASGLMLLAVLLWFASYQELMTNDKFLTLFGRALPATSLVVSMIFRFIGQLTHQAREILLAQRVLFGESASKGRAAVKRTARMTSVLMGWSMEQSIETADSMRARGFGSHKRTSYHPYRLGHADALALIMLGALIVVNLIFIFTAANRVMFYPYFDLTTPPLLHIVCYALLLLFPFLVELGGLRTWLLFPSNK